MEGKAVMTGRVEREAKTSRSNQARTDTRKSRPTGGARVAESDEPSVKTTRTRKEKGEVVGVPFLRALLKHQLWSSPKAVRFGVLAAGIGVILMLLLVILSSRRGNSPEINPGTLAGGGGSGAIYFTHLPDRASRSSGMICRSEGSKIVQVVSGLDHPRDVQVDLSRGKMYWVNGGGVLAVPDKIQRANIDGTGIETLLTLQSDSVRHIALDRLNGKLYYTTRFAREIRVANFDGKNDARVTGGIENVFGIAVDSAGGKVYWTDMTTGIVARANIDGTGRQNLLVLNPAGLGIAVIPRQGFLYVSLSGNGGILRARLDGSSQQRLLEGKSAHAISVDPTNNRLYVADGGSTIWTADLDGNRYEVVATGLQSVWGIDAAWGEK